jgi:hypothetical protein
MPIFRLEEDSSNNYETLVCTKSEQSLTLNDWVLKGIRAPGKTVSLRAMSPEWSERSGDPLKPDFTKLYGVIPVFSARAVKVLGPLLSSAGEFVEAVCSLNIYYIFRATTIINAERENVGVTHEAITIDGRPFYLPKGIDRQHTVFRIKQFVTRTFVTESLQEAFASNGLVGACFLDVANPIFTTVPLHPEKGGTEKSKPKRKK